MVKNERGSTLLVVLLMMLVFTVLGLSIISASIGGAKRTEIRETEIEDNLGAIKTLNEAVAFIKATIDKNYDEDMSFTEYNKLIEDKILPKSTGYDIEDVTSNGNNNINPNEDFTRILQVTSGDYRQKVYITGMPSFLKYAVGSRRHLTLNGSVYTTGGNIYAYDGLTISDTARYIYNGDPKEKKTQLPSVSDPEQKESFLFLENGKIEYCAGAGACYSGNTVNSNQFYFLDPLNKVDLEKAFNPYAPTYTQEKAAFVELDILKTFLEKLKVGGFYQGNIGTKGLSEEGIKDKIKSTINGASSGNVKIIDKITNEPELDINGDSLNVIENKESVDSYLYKGDAFIDTNNLKVDKSKWLVIDGDATFESIGAGPMKIEANILVTGDATFRGNLELDSTIYVLGNSTINNVTIKGLNNKELILMTQGKLELAIVNVNKSSTELETKPDTIKAYLYTASDAKVYAVGSNIQIEGGLFSKGDLEINAFRGTARLDTIDLDFKDKPDVDSSRFVIKNNKRLFIDTAQSLPKLEKLEVLTDLMVRQ